MIVGFIKALVFCWLVATGVCVVDTLQRVWADWWPPRERPSKLPRARTVRR